MNHASMDDTGFYLSHLSHLSHIGLFEGGTGEGISQPGGCDMF